MLALEDPGVDNWLDPVGVKTGSALLRFYKSDGNVVPTVRKVSLSNATF